MGDKKENMEVYSYSRNGCGDDRIKKGHFWYFGSYDFTLFTDLVIDVDCIMTINYKDSTRPVLVDNC